MVSDLIVRTVIINFFILFRLSFGSFFFLLLLLLHACSLTTKNVLLSDWSLSRAAGAGRQLANTHHTRLDRAAFSSGSSSSMDIDPKKTKTYAAAAWFYVNGYEMSDSSKLNTHIRCPWWTVMAFSSTLSMLHRSLETTCIAPVDGTVALMHRTADDHWTYPGRVAQMTTTTKMKTIWPKKTGA